MTRESRINKKGGKMPPLKLIISIVDSTIHL